MRCAAVIAAGLDGIDRELSPGEPQNINHYSKTTQELEALGIDILPQSLTEAVDELERDALFADQLGKDIVGEFAALKRMEWPAPWLALALSKTPAASGA